MIIHTWGDPSAPAVILLHPMVTNGNLIIEHLGKRIPGNYYLIAPDQGGHGEDKSKFNPEQDAAELYSFLREKGISQIELLFAASMGGLTAIEVLKTEGLYFKTVHLDGIPLAKAGGFTAFIHPFVMVLSAKKARKNPAGMAEILLPMYGDVMSKAMAQQFALLSYGSVFKAAKDCTNGCIAPLDQDRCRNIVFEWGENEINVVKGKPAAEELYPWAKIIVRKGLRHCEFLGKEPEAYAQCIKEEMESAV